MRKRGVIAADYLIWIIIALGVLVVGFIVLMLQGERGNAALEFLKNLVRFGR